MTRALRAARIYVHRLREQWGESPWDRATLGSLCGGRGASGANPDVIIIGGGLTGLSTAYHLAKRGLCATIAEAATIGDGASGRTGGLVLEGAAGGILPGVDDCVGGLARLVEREQIDCQLELPGCWEIEHRAAPHSRSLPWNDCGYPISIIRIDKGGVVEPARLMGGLARAAVRQGAWIRENTTVRRIEFEPQLTIHIGDERIHPGYAVIAANAWTGAIVPGVRLTSSMTFACATEPLDDAAVRALGLGERIPFFTADHPYLWGRTTSDGRLIFGSNLIRCAPSSLDATDVRGGNPHAQLDDLITRVRRLNPILKDVRFPFAWAGPIAFTEDMTPILSRLPQCARVLVAGAYAGHGVALSVRVGELLALNIAENRPLPEWGRFRTPRPKS